MQALETALGYVLAINADVIYRQLQIMQHLVIENNRAGKTKVL